MKPSEMHLFYEPKDRLRLSVQDRSWPTVVPVWASPLQHPGRYLGLMDGKGHEITTLADPDELESESLAAVREELHRRYLTALVTRVVDVKGEWGATYWSVDTTRGHREFVTQSLQENAQWLEAHHILITDVDGNKFEFKDIDKMDDRSQMLIHKIL